MRSSPKLTLLSSTLLLLLLVVVIVEPLCAFAPHYYYYVSSTAVRTPAPHTVVVSPSVAHTMATKTTKTTWLGATNDNNKNNENKNNENGGDSGDAENTPSEGVTMGLNELQTLLREAAQRQDFVEAGRLSDEIFSRMYDPATTTDGGDDNNDDETKKNYPAFSAEEKRLKRKRMSWRGLGAAPWLVDRLDSLNYTFPTTIQINTMESVNQILNATEEVRESSTSLEAQIMMNQQALLDDDPTNANDNDNNNNMGIVVSGSTGSGKTLSFLVPLLSTLSDSLFTRQRIRVGAEEKVGDTTGDLLDRIAVVTSPTIRSNSRRSVRQGSAIATGASLATLGTSGKDVKSPLALIVVPTRELGIQTAMLLYELVGGSVKKDATEIRGRANMFKYKGPKGVRIGCVLEDDEAEFGLKLQTDVAITMPKYLGKLMDDGDLVASKLRVVILDEADLALEQIEGKDLTALFDEPSKEEDDDDDQQQQQQRRAFNRLTFLVGASVTESLGNLAVRSRMLPEGRSYIATATRHAPLLADRDLDSSQDVETHPLGLVGAQAASLKELNVCLDPGLRHKRVRVRNGEVGLLVLTRLLRKELQAHEERRKTLGDSVPRPRVVVFFPNEEMAKASIAPLRDALWGEHKLCVLLPKIGVNPLQMMEQFKSNETTVMLATPNSVRGLDFPAVSHVYTLYLPMDDPREYVHLAGRTGRVGQVGSVQGGGGQVISILQEDDAEQMDVLAKELGFEFIDVNVEKVLPLARTTDGEVDLDSGNVEQMRRYLEDTVSFFNVAADDPESDATADNTYYESGGGATIDVDYDDEEEDDEDDDDAASVGEADDEEYFQ